METCVPKNFDHSPSPPSTYFRPPLLPQTLSSPPQSSQLMTSPHFEITGATREAPSLPFTHSQNPLLPIMTKGHPSPLLKVNATPSLDPTVSNGPGLQHLECDMLFLPKLFSHPLVFPVPRSRLSPHAPLLLRGLPPPSHSNPFSALRPEWSSPCTGGPCQDASGCGPGGPGHLQGHPPPHSSSLLRGISAHHLEAHARPHPGAQLQVQPRGRGSLGDFSNHPPS